VLLVQALYGEVAGIDSFVTRPTVSKRLFANANPETAKGPQRPEFGSLDNKNENVGKTLLDILLRPQSWSLSRVPFALSGESPAATGATGKPGT